MDLKEELEQAPVAQLRRIEDDLDCLGVRAVVAIGRVRHVAAAVADPGRDDAVHLADQVLHAPEAAAGEDCAFGRRAAHRTSSAWSR